MTTSLKMLLGVSSLLSLVLPATAPAQSLSAVNKAAILATFHAEGAQLYECKPDTSEQAGKTGALVWQFREPIAALLVDGKTVGRHYAGPNWDVADGSGVKGKSVKSSPAPDASDIPWLELEVVDHRNKGILSEAVTVLRINTKGGLAQGSCDSEGKYLSIPYAADYVFLRKSD